MLCVRLGCNLMRLGTVRRHSISAEIFWRSQNVREMTDRRRLYSVPDEVNEIEELSRWQLEHKELIHIQVTAPDTRA